MEQYVRKNLSNAHEFIVCYEFEFIPAVKTWQIRSRADYSCRRTNQRSFDNAFVNILYFAPFMNTHTNGCLQYHVAAETLTKLLWWRSILQSFFEQAIGSYFKKIKYIKTVHINLREWQKWRQLLILSCQDK